MESLTCPGVNIYHKKSELQLKSSLRLLKACCLNYFDEGTTEYVYVFIALQGGCATNNVTQIKWRCAKV